ncbi:MAG: glutathione transferase GstA [Alphaproteobacteria bacterium]|nr:MAG: glutathione transferase GstA [Alphaproteobacteria bacterium]
MKLYYKPGACSMAAHILLSETNAPYSLEKVDTIAGTTETGADYIAINPRGYVPALELDNGAIITENIALLQFLAGQFPELGLEPPEGELGQIRVLEALSYLSSELHKAFTPFFSARVMGPEEKAAAHAKLSSSIGQIEAMLSDGRPYLTGTDITVADFYAFVILNWTNFIDVSLQPWPKTTAFVEKIAQRPSVQRVLKKEGLAA